MRFANIFETQYGQVLVNLQCTLMPSDEPDIIQLCVSFQYPGDDIPFTVYSDFNTGDLDQRWAAARTAFEDMTLIRAEEMVGSIIAQLKSELDRQHEEDKPRIVLQ